MYRQTLFFPWRGVAWVAGWRVGVGGEKKKTGKGEKVDSVTHFCSL